MSESAYLMTEMSCPQCFDKDGTLTFLRTTDTDRILTCVICEDEDRDAFWVVD